MLKLLAELQDLLIIGGLHQLKEVGLKLIAEELHEQLHLSTPRKALVMLVLPCTLACLPEALLAPSGSKGMC